MCLALDLAKVMYVFIIFSISMDAKWNSNGNHCTTSQCFAKVFKFLPTHIKEGSEGNIQWKLGDLCFSLISKNNGDNKKLVFIRLLWSVWYSQQP